MSNDFHQDWRLCIDIDSGPTDSGGNSKDFRRVWIVLGRHGEMEATVEMGAHACPMCTVYLRFLSTPHELHTIFSSLRCLDIPRPDSQSPPSPYLQPRGAECQKLLGPPCSVALITLWERRNAGVVHAVLILPFGAGSSVTCGAWERRARLQDLHSLLVVLFLCNIERHLPVLVPTECVRPLAA